PGAPPPLPDPPVLQPLVLGDWTDAFVRTPKGAPPGAGEAMAWLEYKQALRQREAVRADLALFAYAGATGLAGPYHRLAMTDAERRGLLRFPPRHDESGADAVAMRAIPILALRAARRAIAENPDHPDGYYALA